MSVGTWNASTGRTVVTTEDLQSIVEAHADHLVDRPPIKLGHTDTRFKGDSSDGNPAFGWVENPWVSDDGTTLVGDIAGIPSKLAEVASTAWRRRSAEIAWGVKTAAGKSYRAVLTGLAFLGVTPPAVKGLPDILALYSSDEYQAPTTLETAAGHSAVFFSEGDTPPNPPQNAIVADGEVQNPASGGGKATGGAAVAVSEKIREALGLSADATDEQTAKALADNGLQGVPAVPAAIEGPPPLPEKGEAVRPVAPATQPGNEQSPPVAPVAVAAPTVQVDAAQFSAAQSTITALSAQVASFQAEKDAERRNHILDTALRAGKIHPIVVSQYRAMLDADEANTTSLLEMLPAVMPTTEFGHNEQTRSPGFTDDDLKAANRALGLES